MYLGGKLDKVEVERFGDERQRARRTQVALDHFDVVEFGQKLNVERAANLECGSDLGSNALDALHCVCVAFVMQTKAHWVGTQGTKQEHLSSNHGSAAKTRITDAQNKKKKRQHTSFHVEFLRGQQQRGVARVHTRVFDVFADGVVDDRSVLQTQHKN